MHAQPNYCITNSINNDILVTYTNTLAVEEDTRGVTNSVFLVNRASVSNAQRDPRKLGDSYIGSTGR